MKNTIIIFLISTIIGFGGGYYFFAFTGENIQQNEVVQEESEAPTSSEKEETTPTSVSANTEIFTNKGCIQCHSISELNLNGGVTGPDLSNAYAGVEGKHGKPLDEFLKEPTSAVMSGVIKGNPLTDEERTKIVEILKTTSEN